MSRARAYVFGCSLIAAVASPVLFPPGHDSYPLSSYPMFSQRRERAQVYFARVVEPTGPGARVPPEHIAGPEVMQAAVTVRRAIQAGKPAMKTLCRRIAANVAGDPRFSEAQRVELVSAEIDPIAYFVEGPEPLRTKRHHHCRVGERK